MQLPHRACSSIQSSLLIQSVEVDRISEPATNGGDRDGGAVGKSLLDVGKLGFVDPLYVSDGRSVVLSVVKLFYQAILLKRNMVFVGSLHAYVGWEMKLCNRLDLSLDPHGDLENITNELHATGLGVKLIRLHELLVKGSLCIVNAMNRATLLACCNSRNLGTVFREQQVRAAMEFVDELTDRRLHFLDVALRLSFDHQNP
mmetsp:Transcript_119050/g.233875  ORF Transcript_119050/g.233875 Transcript_119050/m.233875 type:complete len:201 (+) Transcript_119050:1322-1924(+)